MKFCANLIKLILISKILSIDILNRFNEKTISCEDEFIILNSSEFKKGEKIYLEIEANRFYKDFINYEFTDNISSYEKYENKNKNQNKSSSGLNEKDENITYSSIFGKESNETTEKMPFHEKDSKNHKFPTKTSITREFDVAILVKKYFNIKKKIKKENNGNYLAILFYCTGDALIKNAEENNGDNFLLNKIFIFLFFGFLCILILINLILLLIRERKSNENPKDNENLENNNHNNGNTNSNIITNNNENTDSNRSRNIINNSTNNNIINTKTNDVILYQKKNILKEK